MNDASEVERVQLSCGIAADGKSYLSQLILKDKDGDARFVAGWNKQNKPTLFLYDGDGNLVDGIGGK